MARVQAADYEQKRIGIVEKSAELFARRGFNGASITDIATACDTSKSLLYHYFPSKEDILFEVMASHIDQLVEDAGAVEADAGDARARLGMLIHRFMEHYVGAADRQKVLLNELSRLPDAKRAVIVEKQRRIIAILENIVVEIEPALKRDPHRAKAKTMLVFGMINWTHTWFDPAGPVSAFDLAELALDTIGAGARR